MSQEKIVQNVAALLEMDGLKIMVDHRPGYSKGKSRAFVHFEGDSPAWPGLARELHSQDTKSMKEVLVKALILAGFSFDKVSFSQKAGCSCSCSPGFVLRGHWGDWFFVNVEDAGRQPRTMGLGESLVAGGVA